MSYFPTLPELTDEQIREAAEAAQEPNWLQERRVAAWHYFASSEPPTWKRTDLSDFKPELIAPSQVAVATDLQTNGTLPSGVLFLPLSEAVRSHGDLVQRYLGTAISAQAHKFSALQAALWKDGVLVYVPRGVAVELPLHATLSIPADGNSLFAHHLVVLEDGASATFIEEYRSDDREDQTYAASVTEIFLGNGSSLRYIPTQTWGSNVYHIGSQLATVGNDASLQWVALNLGGKLQHIEAETSLVGKGANVQWLASTFANGGQALLTAPWLRHIGTNTEGHMDFKTVVQQHGYTVFDGMIKIEKDSHGTISRLEEHAIHLSDGARSDSIPGLKIDTNDVQRAGHASTSGQVDEEMLFYMRSRGIKRDEAIRMIVNGFFEPVLDRVPEGALRERLGLLIESKI